MLTVRDCERAVWVTRSQFEAVVAEHVAVIGVPRRRRPVNETSLDEAVEVLGETIAMRHQSVSGQRREVKLVVADDPTTRVPSPSSRIRSLRSFGGKPIALDAASFLPDASQPRTRPVPRSSRGHWLRASMCTDNNYSGPACRTR